MIINNAGSRCSIGFWTKHLQSREENERAELKEMRGLNAADLHGALLEMQEEASILPRLKNFMYHADFNPRAEERLTEEQWERAFEIFEKQRGISKGTPRIVYEHEKQGRIHRHVIWTRLDVENMRAFPDGLDWKVAHTAAREIEKKLRLQKTVGPLDRQQGTPRPPRGPEPWEMYRAMKTGIDPRDLTAEVTALFQQSLNGKEFQAALELHGYPLVTGRRGLLILDSAGKEHSLVKRIEGVRTAELNAFMRDVDRAALPTLEQGKAQYQERKITALEADRSTVRDEIQWLEALERAAIAKERTERQFVEPQEREKEETRTRRERGQGDRQKESPINPPPHQSWPGFEKASTEAIRDDRTQNLRGPAAQAWEAFCRSDSAKAFAAALDDKGIMFAAVTKEEAYRSHREAEFAKAAGNYAPRFKEGETVIVTEPRAEYRRDDQMIVPGRVHKLDPSLAYQLTKGLDNKLQGIDATLKAPYERARQRAADRRKIRLENATNGRGRPRIPATDIEDGIHKSAAVIGKAASLAAPIGGVLDGICGMLESLVAPKLTPEHIHDREKARDRREDEAETTIDFSRVTAEMAQQRRQQENEQEAARAQERDRDGGGRER